jgi:hypothetical protein
LQKSLNGIIENLENELKSSAYFQTFLTAVKELIQNLITVALYHDRLNNSDIVYDPATLVDFYYNIAKGSSYSPDLRISWLFNIAKLQLDVYVFFISFS